MVTINQFIDDLYESKSIDHQTAIHVRDFIDVVEYSGFIYPSIIERVCREADTIRFIWYSTNITQNNSEVAIRQNKYNSSLYAIKIDEINYDLRYSNEYISTLIEYLESNDLKR